MPETASPHLCQELYDLSGWKTRTPHGSIAKYPAYTAGYLLRKLPNRTEDIIDTAMLGRNSDNTGWSAVYRDLGSLGDTPENALAKLLINLFKSGVLQKETEA